MAQQQSEMFDQHIERRKRIIKRSYTWKNQTVRAQDKAFRFAILHHKDYKQKRVTHINRRLVNQLEEDLGKIFGIQIHNLVLKWQRKKKPNDKWKS